MKTLLTAAFLAASLSLAGLSAARAGDAPPAPRVVAIHAGAGNTMTFDVTKISAMAGEPLKVVLTNAGTLPKTVMGHNWVLLKPGSDPVAFAAAGAAEPENGYIPTKLKGQIVAFIALLGPGETGVVTFNAPAQPGEYPFLCAFPAHCLVGMKGVLVVK
jgi:azurin